MEDTSNRAFWDRKMQMSCRIHQIELFGVERCQFAGWQSDKGYIISLLGENLYVVNKKNRYMVNKKAFMWLTKKTLCG